MFDKKKSFGIWLSALPLLWITVFFFVPILIMLTTSFASHVRGKILYWPPTLSAYFRIFDFTYLKIFGTSFALTLVCTAICFCVGYPLAYFIARQPSTWRKNALVILVAIPFFSNFLARMYGWFILLKQDGWISILFHWMGASNNLTHSHLGVAIGLVYAYLPLMVLPLYSTLEKLDYRLIEAARDLGANTQQVVCKVLLPWSARGILAGCTLVSVPMLGEFVIPRLMGGGKIPAVGILIEETFLGTVSSNWPLGAALSFILLAVAIVMLKAFRRKMVGKKC